MPIVVYQTDPDGEHKTFNAPANFGARDIDKALVLKEGQAVNWFGTTAKTPEAAIEEAKEGGYKYQTPEHMNRLQNQVTELSRASDYAIKKSQNGGWDLN